MKILFFTLLIFTTQVSGQCNAKLNKYITGFDQLKSSSFSFLDGRLENIKIVGYGEDTHGSAEFSLVAKELIEYLSKQHNFNILIFKYTTTLAL